MEGNPRWGDLAWLLYTQRRRSAERIAQLLRGEGCPGVSTEDVDRYLARRDQAAREAARRAPRGRK